MSSQAFCPSCEASLTIPDGCRGKKGRCSHCGTIFSIDEVLDAARKQEETVLGWLSEPDVPAGVTAVTPQPAQYSGPTAQPAKPAGGEPRAAMPVRLDHVDEMGAFFVFPSALLADEDFRSSFPQRCVTCGSREDLSVYLIDWSIKRSLPRSSQRLDDRVPPKVELRRLGGASGRALLAKLPRVATLPEPYCLPFPYCVCNCCTPVGALVTDIRPAGDGAEICELGIASLEQAVGFAQAACGAGSEAMAALRQHMRRDRQSAWKLLPLAVRNRISQWYVHADGETFLAYIPDADFARAEAGLAGVVVTDRRLVYRKSVAKVEIPIAHSIDVRTSTTSKGLMMRLSSPGCKPVNLAANTASANQLQTLLRRLQP